MGTNGHRVFGRGMDLGAFTRKTVRVEIPETDCVVILRELSSSEVAGMEKNKDIPHQLALMIVDEQGQRIFQTEEEIQNLGENMGFSTAILLMKEGAKLNGISKEALDDAIKNSAASLRADSASV
jgi:hypothetical protein